MKETLNIACFQQDIVWEQPDANRRLVEEAFAPLGRDADILVVPETFTTGFSDNMAAMAEEPEGETYRFAHRMAQLHDALFVGTWTVQIAPGTVVNRLHWGETRRYVRLLRQRAHVPHEQRGVAAGAWHTP